MDDWKPPPQPILVPPLRIRSDGRLFEMLRAETKIRSDGYLTSILHWGAECEECGERFEFRTTYHIRGFTRRCERHRKRKRAANPDEHLGAP